MRRRITPVLAGISLGLVVVLAAGCSSAAGGGAQVEKPDLTVAAVPVGDEAGLYVAQDRGLFTAEGLNVRIVSAVSSADIITGQNDRRYDISAGNAVSYIQAQVSGQANLEIIAVGSLMQPGNQALYTLPGSPITSIADLAGKRIGVNAPENIGTLLISSVLADYGIARHEVRFVVMPFPDMGPALQHHQIDVAWLPDPFGSIFAEQYGLAQLTDLDQGATTNFPVSWYVVTKAWAKKYPHTLAAFLAALRQGQQIADTDRAAVEQAMETLPPPYTVPPAIAGVMSLDSYPVGISLPSVQRVADTMYQFQMLNQPFRVSSMLG
ncbi:MAG: ABC transporter substrate-binding protein [Streptosporangiaceae bacterium]|nr:ABC transporter substrate-binding protein [Streptosporangiaceae bacterium]